MTDTVETKQSSPIWIKLWPVYLIACGHDRGLADGLVPIPVSGHACASNRKCCRPSSLKNLVARGRDLHRWSMPRPRLFMIRAAPTGSPLPAASCLAWSADPCDADCRRNAWRQHVVLCRQDLHWQRPARPSRSVHEPRWKRALTRTPFSTCSRCALFRSCRFRSPISHRLAGRQISRICHCDGASVSFPGTSIAYTWVGLRPRRDALLPARIQIAQPSPRTCCQPCIALGLVALIPVIYKKITGRKTEPVEA